MMGQQGYTEKFPRTPDKMAGSRSFLKFLSIGFSIETDIDRRTIASKEPLQTHPCLAP